MDIYIFPHQVTQFHTWSPLGSRTPFEGMQSPSRVLFLPFINRGYIVCSKSGGIYTVDDTNPTVQCIAVRDTRIVATGDLEKILSRRAVDSALSLVAGYLPWVAPLLRRLARPTIKYIPDNAIVVPGLTDAHAHVIENGYMKQLPLTEAQSVQEIVELVKQYIEAHPDIRDDPSRWVEGMGWDQTKWPGRAFPVAADLDQDPVLKGRFISLNRVDGHACWVSPAVLELMGDLPGKVDGGEVVRDTDGKPTGVFLDNAMDLVPNPPWTEEQMSSYFETTMKEALSSGLTSIHDAMSRPEMIHFFKKKAEDGELPLRLYLMGHASESEYWGPNITRLINHGKHGRLNCRAIKLVSDGATITCLCILLLDFYVDTKGALGSWGAALLQPYSDKPETNGIMVTQPNELKYLINRFYDDGWQVNVHCIGDRGNKVVLDIYEDIIEGRVGKPKADVKVWRPRIEHAQIMSLDDLERTGRLGVIPSVQPTHATSDMWYAETRLGPERVKGAYAYQTLTRTSHNGVIALGSDFPVEGVNPLLGFYAAVSRLSVDGTSPHGEGGWFPDERLTRYQALKGMTLDAAYASFSEHDLGSLVTGKKADFTVLDRNLMVVPVMEILDTKVIATIVDGEVVFGGL
ncbi:hypothetical protein AMATHDRAFT_75863 [Amanita thiersii Skay4041]|uniref:Amidohydrolase 3 domain-containing protein n=1 Tax=Amanita thiersii Skay4041 TaxID=703135 RepID=A0A2A9NNS5_9AGAR|nr:hypothetical protein AMATHDRAFT_75863 [Amanita thiersii Skay4041]